VYIHRALQYFKNVLTEFSYLLINFWHLSLTFELGSRQRKYPWHSLINSIFELLNNFMHIWLYVKSRECRSTLLSWHDSRPYKRVGINFLVISFKITSSEAKFRILLKMPLTARYKLHRTVLPLTDQQRSYVSPLSWLRYAYCLHKTQTSPRWSLQPPDIDHVTVW